jgi:hypothetical protein
MGNNAGLKVVEVGLTWCCISIGTMSPDKPEMGKFIP